MIWLDDEGGRAVVDYFVAVLALIVAGEYAVIAFNIVPRLAALAAVEPRVRAAARWGATAFFGGCAVTHIVIALNTLSPSLRAGMDMSAGGGPAKLIVEMVVPHLAQIVGGALFIGIARRRLEVNITSKEVAAGRRELDHQLRAAFDLAPLGIALPSPAGAVSSSGYVNPAYWTIHGYPAERSSPPNLDVMTLVHPDDRAAAVAAINQVQTGNPADLSYRIVRPDGETRWIHSRLSPVASITRTPARVTTILEDITDQINADIALAQSEQRFVQLASSVAIGINLRQLRPPKVLYSNAAYDQILGIDPTPHECPDVEASLDDQALPLIHPDDLDRVVAEYWTPAQAGHVVSSEHRVMHRDGEIRWVHTTSTPILDNDGRITRVAGTVEDITGRRTAEAAVRAAQLEAERANTAKSEFLSRMSHELRTPMNAVLGFAQLLELDALSVPQKDAVSHIIRGGRHLMTLIDDILDISRIETDRLDTSLEPVAVPDLIADSVGLMIPLASSAGIDLRVAHNSNEANTGPYVRADRKQLQQILLNLLSNAIKYTKSPGIVELNTHQRDDGQLEITVTDTGIGIRAEDLPRLFTPFDRLGQESTDVEGTGIGLALTQRLARVMGGDLHVESVFGKSSTFTIVLPVIASPDTYFPPSEADSSIVESSASAASASSLLYIDDNHSNIDLMTRIVDRRPNWVLTTATQGRHGLDLAREVNPTLILLDLHLPDMHGIDVLHALRAEPATASIPIIVVSADANPQHLALLHAAGAARYRTKPINIAEILYDLDEYATSAPRASQPLQQPAAVSVDPPMK